MGIQLDRGARLQDHAFGWGQLVFACAGVGRVETDIAQWVLPTARALWVPPNVRHVLHCTTVVDLRTLYFGPDALPAVGDTCTVLEVGPLLRELIVRAVSLRAPQLDEARHRRLIGVIYDELACAPRESLVLPLPRDERARRLAALILASPGSTESLDDRCEGIGASRRTVERRFREETGTSLGAWARLARLHHAVQLLGEGQSVAGVSEAAGYDSVSAFVAAFRRTFGRSPGRYFAEQAP